MNFTIKQGMNQDILKSYPDNYFDSIVTDPPYGIEFLGKDWDTNTGAVETWQECLRVLKPGGHLLAFSAARTYHHLATNIESVGFEIRDQIMWIYASGFPKAQDIGKAIQKRQGVEQTKTHKKLNGYAIEQTAHGAQRVGDVTADDYEKTINETVCTSPQAQQWAGWKTALKPAHEPIVMARKPMKGSTINNVLEHGVGALNIDATRIEYDGDKPKPATFKNGISYRQHTDELYGKDADHTTERTQEYNDQGRFPSNVLGDIPDYQKYFYCPKVSRAERHCGFEQTNIPTGSGGMYDNHGTGKMYNIATDMTTKKGSLAHIPTNPDGMYAKNDDGTYKNPGEAYMKTAMKQRTNQSDLPPNKNYMVEAMGGTWVGDNMIELPHKGKIYVHGLKEEYDKFCKQNNVTKPNVGNNHPTVKPVELMKYLVKLVTPKGGVVLDPFNGSGSTGMACVELGMEYVGCELDPNYVEIATKRITAWYERTRPDNNFEELFE